MYVVVVVVGRSRSNGIAPFMATNKPPFANKLWRICRSFGLFFFFKITFKREQDNDPPPPPPQTSLFILVDVAPPPLRR
uniref:Uncharacterized protein n=1 Tax=Trichuris muris TaxID=70415 RepID=A0A5S6QR77_TRIMR